MEYKINTTWNSTPVMHRPVTLTFKLWARGLLMEVNAPIFNDPPAPSGAPGIIPFESATPLLGIYRKENKLFYQKDTSKHMFIAELFTVAKTWNQSKCS
uniref:Uncharacterized protein n=1 Tax=Theropithecus gelada TaxID=9565 RepID=A0A8D2EVA5_THEGE